MTRSCLRDVDRCQVDLRGGIPYGSGARQGACTEAEVRVPFREDRKEATLHPARSMPVPTARRIVQLVSLNRGRDCYGVG